MTELLTSTWFGIAVGVPVGFGFWYVALRPRQLNEHERRRRQHGLPPKRTLPEDEDR